jgi:hypothetical protein
VHYISPLEAPLAILKDNDHLVPLVDGLADTRRSLRPEFPCALDLAPINDALTRNADHVQLVTVVLVLRDKYTNGPALAAPADDANAFVFVTARHIARQVALAKAIVYQLARVFRKRDKSWARREGKRARLEANDDINDVLP